MVAEKDIVFSASQVQTFKECQRRWGFQYIDKIKTPPNRYATFGSDTHTVLEDHFGEDKKPIDEETFHGQVAAGIAALHPPNEGRAYTVERKFSYLKAGNRYRGYVDLFYIDDEANEVVSDHKTTGNMRYAKTEEELRINVQAILYACEQLDRFGSSDVKLLWGYGLRNKKTRAKAVSLTIGSIEAHAAFARYITPHANEMKHLHLAQAKTADLPPSLDHCSAYGGCPHAAYCERSDSEIIKAAFGGNKSKAKAEKKDETKMAGTSTLDRMMARAAATQGKTPKTEAKEELTNSKGQKPPQRVSEMSSINPPEQPSEEEAVTQPEETPKEDANEKAPTIKAMKAKEFLAAVADGTVKWTTAKKTAEREGLPYVNAKTVNKARDEGQVLVTKSGVYMDVRVAGATDTTIRTTDAAQEKGATAEDHEARIAGLRAEGQQRIRDGREKRIAEATNEEVGAGERFISDDGDAATKARELTASVERLEAAHKKRFPKQAEATNEEYLAAASAARGEDDPEIIEADVSSWDRFTDEDVKMSTTAEHGISAIIFPGGACDRMEFIEAARRGFAS